MAVEDEFGLNVVADGRVRELRGIGTERWLPGDPVWLSGDPVWLPGDPVWLPGDTMWLAEAFVALNLKMMEYIQDKVYTKSNSPMVC